MAELWEHYHEFESLDTEVVALSSDAEEDARGTVDMLALQFPVIFGIDPEAASSAIGCYTGVHEGKAHVQPAGFVLTPDGVVAHAVYASGKVGRLTANDALTVIKDLRKRAADRAAAG